MNAYLQPVRNLTRLAPHAQLWANASACLPQRFADIACSRCTDECPRDVLKVGHDGFTLAQGCVDCGRCAAACPTGALSLGGFHFEAPSRPAGTLRVECRKVAEAHLAAGTVRVPCTAALRLSDLLALVNAADDAGVAVVDRGWCSHCSAGGQAEHPAHTRIAEANALLAAVGAAPLQRLVFCTERLPVTQMPEAIPEPGGQRELGRRGFLRQLVGQAAASIANDDTQPSLGEPTVPDGNARILPSERLAVLAELRRASRHGDDELPASLFYTVTISDACRDHHLCARSCPTTALNVAEATGHAGVHFHPALCIGCAQCTRSCPEGAVTLIHAAAHDVAPGQARPLTRSRLSRCFECGATYPKHSSIDGEHADSRCPACHKSDELTHSLFSGLFSSSQANPAANASEDHPA